MHQVNSYRYRVHFTQAKGTTPPRDVYARDEAGARHCALTAERLTGNKARGLRAGAVHQLYPVGYQTQPELIDRTEAGDVVTW